MSYKIPFFDLNFGPEEEAAVVDTLKSKWISMGPKTQEFESRFATMLNVKYAVGLSNCTVALHMAMRILDIKEGDEVICPSLTFVATVNAIRYVNAIPVFCDLTSESDLNIDPNKIEKLITNKTKAIVVMHYGGFPCEMEKIVALAKKHNLKIIEDACHGPLSEYNGKKLGTIGDIGCFSFFSNKNISTGEGGMLVTDNEEYYNKAKLIRSHGMTSLSYERSKGHATSYDVVDVGYNYRIDDIRSSIGLSQLDKLPADLEKRKKIRKGYIERLAEVKEIIIPYKENETFVSNYIFPVVIKNSTFEKRDKLRNHLHEAGIQTSVHYPAVHLFSIYKDFRRDLPVTEYATDNEVSLPMYSKLTDDDLDFICNTIKNFFKNF